ncbi:hypothetical protein [Salibacter sp.]|uniref:hypothetical protein n=1 Tax=Salibacter sp. TaxID=2010995 RepID=UPI002870B174|nr:hypothetical protein [Salibacter sp.]MDR9399324.1 hypothetical protein [Salibacter sp.]MDR9487771.1 hypothetical protein [Salibacter sp.]
MNYTKLLTLFFASTIFLSCQKDETVPPTSKPTTINSEISCLPDINYEDNVLKFSSRQTFRDAYNCLESSHKNHASDFINTYEELLEENNYADSIGDSLGYNENEILIQFENSFSGYTSLRKKIYQEEDTWLADSVLDYSDWPHDNYYVQDEILRTIISDNGEIFINDTLFMIQNDGDIYYTDNINHSERENISNQVDVNPSNYDDLFLFSESYFGKTANTCENTDKDKDFRETFNSNYAMKGKLTLRFYPWGSHSKARTFTYRKKKFLWWSWWARNNKSLRTYFQGYLYPTLDCEDGKSKYFSLGGDREYKSRQTTGFNHWGLLVWTKGELHSISLVNNSYSINCNI